MLMSRTSQLLAARLAHTGESYLSTGSLKKYIYYILCMQGIQRYFARPCIAVLPPSSFSINASILSRVFQDSDSLASDMTV
jgi:hypothetical protein